MGKYLAVFTATLFLTALFQCCFAADGASASENPVCLYHSHHSQVSTYII